MNGAGASSAELFMIPGFSRKPERSESPTCPEMKSGRAGWAGRRMTPKSRCWTTNSSRSRTIPRLEGKLALRCGLDSAFLSYAGRADLTVSKFSGEYYLSGDLAARDEKGRFKFIGRDDDIINTSGHLLGPFEVESVLTADASVADAAVVSVPDPLIFEAVAAVLVLKEGAAWSEELVADRKSVV